MNEKYNFLSITQLNKIQNSKFVAKFEWKHKSFTVNINNRGKLITP